MFAELLDLLTGPGILLLPLTILTIRSPILLRPLATLAIPSAVLAAPTC